MSSSTDHVHYASDEEPPEKEDKMKMLHWTMDRSESLSDWTIHIRSSRKAAPLPVEQEGSQQNGKKELKEEEQIRIRIDTYHVHKAILAAGPRKSEYFAALLKSPSAGFSEMRTATSTVEMHELAADAFPELLDYLYSAQAETPPKLSTDNAAALHYLGRYFQIKPLQWEAMRFWKDDLNFDNCATYFRHGKIFGNEKLIDAIVSMCARNVIAVGTDTGLLEATDSQFWLAVLERWRSEEERWRSEGAAAEVYNKSDLLTRPRHEHMSRLVAIHCSNIKNDVDVETFARLTDSRNLPNVAADAACMLLDAERRLSASEGDAKLSCLKKRCIRGLSKGWDNSDVRDSEIKKHLCGQDPRILSEMIISLNKRLRTKPDITERGNQKLRVKGAGNHAVNGIYIFDGIFESAYRYSKDGCWKGSLHQFHIFRCRTLNGNLRWNISIVLPGEEPGTDSDIDFFSATESNSDNVFPPEKGWKAEAEGKGLPPTIDSNPE